MIKRAISVLMILTMLTGAMPVRAWAAQITYYDVWVGGVQVTSENASDVMGEADGEKATVSFVAASGTRGEDGYTPDTLVLSDAKIIGSYASESAGYVSYCGIYSSADMDIVLNGENSIVVKCGGEVSGSRQRETYGVYIDGSSYDTADSYGESEVRIYEGSEGGTLTAAAYDDVGWSCGIKVYGTLTLESGTVMAQSQLCEGAADNRTEYGPRIGVDVNELHIKSGRLEAAAGKAGEECISTGITADSVTVTGGELEATGGEGGSSYGITAYECMDISGGRVQAAGGSSELSCGSAVWGMVYVSGGEFTTTGGAGKQSRGLEVYGMLSVFGGSLNATSGNINDAQGSAYGINICAMMVSDGKVTAKAPAEVCEEAIGIRVHTEYDDGALSEISGVLEVLGGEVSASAGTEGNTGKGKMYAIAADTLLEVSGGSVSAVGGDTDEYSSGIYAYKLAVSGGSVTAAAGEAAAEEGSSDGIWAYIMDMSGGKVAAKSTASAAAWINAIDIYEDYDENGDAIEGTGALRMTGGSITAQCDSGVSNADHSAIWAGSVGVGGITLGSTHELKGAQESYTAGMNSLRQATVGVPVVIKVTSGNGDAEIHRIAGDNRIATAIKISKMGWNRAETVIIACSESYPDALAGAPLAKALGAPILLCSSKELSGAVSAELERLNASEVVILGGTAAISQQTENELAQKYLIERVYGNDRSQTAAKIAQKLSSTKKTAFLVSSNSFADALSVSSAAALSSAPILYVNADGTIPEATREALQQLDCSKAYIIGGTAAIGSNAETELADMGIEYERVFGSSRYQTSTAVYERFSSVFGSTGVSVATGKNFPDALAGAAFAAKNGMPVFLVDDAMPKEAVERIRAIDFDRLYIFGGESAVSEAIVGTLTK